MVKSSEFGKIDTGEVVTAFEIFNCHGESVTVLDFGASILSINVRDRSGKIESVSLGVKSASELTGRNKIGYTVGRCANRIGDGAYEIDGKKFTIEKNQPACTLHSASDNYAKKIFQGEIISDSSVRFYLRDEGKAGFNTNVDAYVKFTFDDNSCLSIDFDLVSDGPTVLSPTNHCYFDLSGGKGISGQRLWVNADNIAAKDENGVPHGQVQSVTGTKFDYLTEREISDSYDDYFLLNKNGGDVVARVYDPSNGRALSVVTDMPCLIIFTPGTAAICLEAQYVPNAVNVPAFASPVFRTGEHMTSHVEYRFGTM